MTRGHEKASQPGTERASPVLDKLASGLGFALVLVSLAWILDAARLFGTALFDEQPIALALGLSLAVVAFGLGPARGGLVRGGGVILGLALFGIMATLALRYPELVVSAMMRPAWLVAVSLALIAGLLFLVWRTIGLPIVLIVLVLSGCAIFGTALGIPTTAVDRWAIYLVIDPNGLLGLPLRVAVQIVIPFVFFGELLRHSGGSAYLTQLCLGAFGGYRGGSAKAAVGASAFFGTISGNAVSNVAGTGIVTIPLMKRTGLRSETAAAVEAAASTGGQLLPPVMGAAAFVMADMLQVPYLHVVTAALLPALLYYAAIIVQIDRISVRNGISGVDASERPDLTGLLRRGWHFFIPFAALFALLFVNQTRPEMAAVGAIVALAVVSALRGYEGKRLRPGDVMRAVIDTGHAVAPLLVITAAAGLVIGLVSLTGLGFSIAGQAVAASGGNTIALLVLVALIAIVFGMGMPTVAVYVVLATVLAPALVETGLAPMQAHLFILYFGLMSMLTPPVALASITGARIAGADMWRTFFVAMRLAWVAYIIPFLFAFSPELLLGGTPAGAAVAAVTAFLGTSAISVAAVGYARAPISGPMRLVYVALGATLLVPPAWGMMFAVANVLGGIAFIALFLASAPAPVDARKRGGKPRIREDKHLPAIKS
ncbi:TRAP transporter fused permease subunit [Chelativorans sp. M5D2P16]|uniref:TRAP transporter permease n=1 Tax=Chelativorans sp. M5D2P16 TaxID=3095678 RepID=UPI002AC9F73C|nr:TRAP transporter fused permease subunit [Chelativorans sp. M5D2P16]MDZ5696558.1 TRAP transporter fused permease subunit [Chelativorans sp. M5D2P16]